MKRYVQAGKLRVKRLPTNLVRIERAERPCAKTLSRKTIYFSILRQGGETGRRTGLKIRSPARGVWVRFPSLALILE